MFYSIYFIVTFGLTNPAITNVALPEPEPEHVSPAPRSVSAVNFEQGEMLMAVLEKAQQENKPIFVDFYTTWCAPCRLMDESVFSNFEIGEYMNSNFINFKVNAEAGNGPNLAAIYEVRSYPTLLFLNQHGEVLVRKEGAAFHQELHNLGDKALQAFSN
jgi:thiol:disulfide interchange protein